MAETVAGLSLWISSPKGSDLDQKLNAIVEHFSKKLGTPKWSPHITLLGSIVATPEEAVSKIQDAVKHRGPLKITLTDIVTKNLYFQCVMAKAEESQPLLSLNAFLRTVYPPHQNEPYWPHLSLVYGDLDAETRNSVVEEIKANKDWDIVGSVINVHVIEVWNTEGPVDGWKLVGQVQL
ncbi:UNVERIFIED_CONTAM: hypothetical protein HDU68_000619 [Siphonaria sp. JEL0065]|nr:hypothetical protein HDU68_000619 [Siphonaria sp. JEL0065]